jgi:CheY-like chemotaxis protein
VTQIGNDSGRPLKVLHVDDDPMNLRVVQEILTAFGHTAVGACSGAEALRRLGGEAFDEVLLDIHMPEKGGIEVLQQLRAAPGPERNTPAIALTADIISRRPQEYVALGFNDFVSKPILVSGLMASIRRAADGPIPAGLRRAAG